MSVSTKQETMSMRVLLNFIQGVPIKNSSLHEISTELFTGHPVSILPRKGSAGLKHLATRHSLVRSLETESLYKVIAGV